MKRKYALLLSLLITLLIGSNFYLFSSFSKNQRESVVIARVIDGDTLELNDQTKIRLVNINTPEKDQKGHDLSTAFLKNWENKSVEIEITGIDKYKRTLARLYSPDYHYLNLEIVKRGFGSKFLVSESETSAFANAEKFAIDNSLGIWNHSVYYGCFRTDINKNAEVVKIINKCKEVNMLSWIIKDESRKIYVFPNIVLGEITLRSSEGIDNSTALFWRSKTNIWNNDRDSLYLFDSQGGLAHYESYGY